VTLRLSPQSFPATVPAIPGAADDWNAFTRSQPWPTSALIKNAKSETSGFRRGTPQGGPQKSERIADDTSQKTTNRVSKKIERTIDKLLKKNCGSGPFTNRAMAQSLLKHTHVMQPAGSKAVLSFKAAYMTK
jgi:hypothetical protein